MLFRWVKQKEGTRDRGNSVCKSKDAERSMSSLWFPLSAWDMQGCAVGVGWDQMGRVLIAWVRNLDLLLQEAGCPCWFLSRCLAV